MVIILSLIVLKHFFCKTRETCAVVEYVDDEQGSMKTMPTIPPSSSSSVPSISETLTKQSDYPVQRNALLPQIEEQFQAEGEEQPIAIIDIRENIRDSNDYETIWARQTIKAEL